MLSEISKLFPKEGTELSNRANRGNWIFRKFIELVMKDDGSHRSVAYYADKLCYSPKHLSTVIRQVSGRSPLSIINAHAIQQIKIQLERSDKTMKELTDEFNFANPSFFGKFVKQHMGMPPQQYRQFHHSHKS
jgi:AraC-like DNA-binding protein